MKEMRTVSKPWGKEEIWAETSKYAGKFLYINPHQSLSRQYHETKEETICVLQGVLRLEVGAPNDSKFAICHLEEGQYFHIKPGTIHRFCADEVSVKLVEVSTPELDDVVRLEDMYSR